MAFHELRRLAGRYVLPVVFPRHCPVCKAIVPFGRYICPSCYSKLTFIQSPCCLRCGKPVTSSDQEYCYDCRSFPKTFTAGCSLLMYNNISRPAMMDYKYKNRRMLTSFYTDELVLRYRPLIRSWHLNAMVPVPIHRKKKKKRGYNQAELLSSSLSDSFHLSHYPDLLIRKVNTSPQKQFTPQARVNNLQAAFCLNPRYRTLASELKAVGLVDDIYTTGATMEACTRILLAAGVGRVYVISVCIGAARD